MKKTIIALLIAVMLLTVSDGLVTASASENNAASEHSAVVINERTIPEGYQLYQDDYFEMYYPADWTRQDKDGKDIVEYGNESGDSFKILLKNKMDLKDMAERGFTILTAKSSNMIQYMGADMLITEQEISLFNYKLNQYVVAFVSGDKTVVITMSYSNKDNAADFEAMYRSILIKQDRAQ